MPTSRSVYLPCHFGIEVAHAGLQVAHAGLQVAHAGLQVAHAGLQVAHAGLQAGQVALNAVLSKSVSWRGREGGGAWGAGRKGLHRK